MTRKAELWIAVAFLAIGLLGAVIWVPLDTDSPPIYEFRRQVFIGDAMLPMVAAIGVAVFAALQILVTLRGNRTADGPTPFDAATFAFFAMVFAILAASLLAMFWSGPLALALFGSGDETVTYRQMRTTWPWKYVGFVLGGFLMVFGLTSLIEGRFRWSRVLSSLLAVAVLILIFDVPFDTILLPPNGDF